MKALGVAYGAVSTWRRGWYSREPSRRRQLRHPVVSVGNLRVGGSGKTPVVAEIARLLLARGEKPAILSRGYRRRQAPDGVTVVSDGTRVIAPVDTAGDEPLMLARELPNVPVLVCADRFLAGTFAETQCGATVHLLDDGFQHVALARDVDLVIVEEDDLSDAVLPAGRLREPIANARYADAVLTTASAGVAEDMRQELGVRSIFRLRRSVGTPVPVSGSAPIPKEGTPILAVAGIARQYRFFDDLVASGWTIADTMTFRDHHWFSASDVERIARAARRVRAPVVLTTAKDAVRLERCDLSALAIAFVPLKVSIEPASFADWLVEQLAP